MTLQARYDMLARVFHQRFPAKPIPTPASDHPQALVNANQAIVAALNNRPPILVRTGKPVEAQHVDPPALPPAPPPRRAHT